jgi:hypothetical protein
MALGVIGGGIIFIIFFYVRGADVTAIASRHICPLTWTILLHMDKSMAAVALNVRSVSHQSDRWSTLNWTLQKKLPESTGRWGGAFGAAVTPFVGTEGHLPTGGGGQKVVALGSPKDSVVHGV